MTESEKFHEMDAQPANEVINIEEDAIVEDNLNGNEAGRAFAHRHVIDKINLFIEEYRRNGYTEDFITGFIDGINDVTGGAICIEVDDEQPSDSESDELETDRSGLQEVPEAG